MIVIPADSTVFVPPFERIASTAVGLLVAGAAIGLMVALVIDALWKIGFRSSFQRKAFARWLRDKHIRAYVSSDEVLDILANIAFAGESRRMLALPHRQLCAQIALALQSFETVPRAARIKVIESFAPRLDQEVVEAALHLLPEGASGFDSAPSRAREARQELAFQLERGVDSLQAYLSSRARWWDTMFGLYVVAIITAILVFALVPDASSRRALMRPAPFLSLLVLGVLTLLFVPFMQRLLTRLSALID